MFGLFSGPECVELIELRDKSLTFLSKKKRKIGVAKIRFMLNMDGKTEKLDLEVALESIRENLAGPGTICTGQLPVTDQTLLTLQGLLLYAPRADLGRGARRSERQRISLRVLSNDVPGYRAVTVDISLHGTQLSVQAPLKVGHQMELTVEFDSSLVPRVTLRGHVVWCREDPHRKGYLIGVEFAGSDPAEMEGLEKYYKILEARSSSDVRYRTLSEGDIYIRDGDPPPTFPGF